MARKVEAEMKKEKTSEKNGHSAEAEGIKGGEMHLLVSQCPLLPIINLQRFSLLVSSYCQNTAGLGMSTSSFRRKPLFPSFTQLFYYLFQLQARGLLGLEDEGFWVDKRFDNLFTLGALTCLGKWRLGDRNLYGQFGFFLVNGIASDGSYICSQTNSQDW